MQGNLGTGNTGANQDFCGWVKIYDQNGRTERPSGPSDSIPFSLEP